MNRDNNRSARDPYIDFMRALGLLLLVGIHVNAPEWYSPMRSFDVPLMAMVSAICYKSLTGGYLRYFQKRVRRIYVPVFTFLTIFFALSFIGECAVGIPDWSLSSIAGSFLLLNSPSIGYVWIMRVFLLMAIMLPFLDRMLRKCNFTIFLLVIFGLIALQHPIVTAVNNIPDKYLRYITDQVIPYASGYSALAVLGLRLAKLTRKQTAIVAIISGTAILVFIGLNGWTFNPQAYKYPPQSLYLLYGVFASTVLFILKPVLAKVTDNRIFSYLSRESMWVYLWHIIPVYALTPWMDVPGFWLGRYAIVLSVAILLNLLWHRLLNFFPSSFSKILG